MTPLAIYFDTLEAGGTLAEAIQAMLDYIERMKTE